MARLSLRRSTAGAYVKQARATRPAIVTLAASVAAIVLTAWAVAPAWTASAVSLKSQPYPDSPEYADAARQLAEGHGYVTLVNEHREVPLFGTRRFPPRYPPGTSVVLAPFALLSHHFPGNVEIGTRAISTAYVFTVVAAAWLLGGPIAGGFAALFVGSSPFASVSATITLSDQLAAVLTAAVLIVIILDSRRTRAGGAVAGAMTGALVAVRLTGVIGLLALVGSVRRRWIALAFAAPFLIGIAVYQWKTFGNPLSTGYSYWLPGLHNFELSYLSHPLLREGPFVFPDKLNGTLLSSLCPCGTGGPMVKLTNYTFYPAVLIGLFWVFAPPLTALIGMAELLRTRATPAARYALITIVLSLVIFGPYFYQAARFMAPAASLLLIYSATGGAALATKIVRRLVGAVRVSAGHA